MTPNPKTISNNSLYNFGVAAVYGVTILAAALLMFLIEPFVAKLLLPLLGGGPNVWNTCIIFFQLILLAGYLYAHLITSRMQRPRYQVVIHLILVWVPLLFLPIKAPSAVPSEEHPVLWLLSMLAGMVGILFFAISATAPLLQKWYSRSGALGFSDPYFLYAFSNVGGLIGLLAYPFLLEPRFSIPQQVQMISAGYVCFAVLVSICGLADTWSNRSAQARVANQVSDLEQNVESSFSEVLQESSSEFVVDEVERETPSTAVTGRDRAIWIALASIPSSLFLGLTSYVTAQLSSIPLFWIVPLTIYLVSFIIAFGRLPAAILRIIKVLAPVSVLLALTTLPSENLFLFGKVGNIPTLSLHFLALILVCTACHGIIASQRPTDNRYLTDFYLCLSVGGLLGSCFNTLAAPCLFKGAEEYPLVLLIAGITLVRLPSFRVKINRLAVWSIVVPLAVFLLAAIPAWFFQIPVKETVLELPLRFGLPLFFCVFVSRRTPELRLGLIVLAGFFLYGVSGIDRTVVYRARNFFGCLSLQIEKSNNTCVLWNGTCAHGAEYLNPELRGKPVFYFYPDGPIGKVYQDLYRTDETNKVQARLSQVSSPSSSNSDNQCQLRPMAVMGLGCGTAVALASPGQTVDFYEINPQVIEVANDPFYFTYLFQAKKRKVDLRIIQGDGRLEMQKAPYSFYKLIILDVYSSSAIPTHLITKEALDVYLQRLTTDGAIAFNITNGFFDLRPVLARVAQEIGLTALTTKEYDRSEGAQEATYIDWVILSKDKKLLDGLKVRGWEILEPDPKFRLWTDDYCNLLGVFEPSFS